MTVRTEVERLCMGRPILKERALEVVEHAYRQTPHSMQVIYTLSMKPNTELEGRRCQREGNLCDLVCAVRDGHGERRTVIDCCCWSMLDGCTGGKEDCTQRGERMFIRRRSKVCSEGVHQYTEMTFSMQIMYNMKSHADCGGYR